MKTILVSGASGLVGYGILKSLRNSKRNLTLVGTSIYDDSVAPAFCDVFEQAIPTTDATYINWLLSIIQKHKVDLIVPGIEADLYKWNENLKVLEDSGVKVVSNNFDLVNLCKDKWAFYSKINAIDKRYLIPSTDKSNYFDIVSEFGLPFLLKPRRGFASKGIIKINNEEEFDLHKQKIPKYLFVQQLVGNDDEEYTASAFCDGHGSFYTKITLRRKLSKDGYTDRAETAHSLNIDEVINHFCGILKPVGPTNFQFRKHKGEFVLLEINPRISSSTSIRMAFGYNESEMAIDYFLDNIKPVQHTLKSGKAIRYTEEKLFFNDSNHF